MYVEIPRGRALACSAVVAFLSIVGCGSSTNPGPPPRPATIDRSTLRVDLRLDAPNGLSGLTRSGDGTLWAIAETDRVLVALVGDRVARLVPVVGLPDGVDAESLAWLGGDRFAIGTESNDEGRTEDAIYIVAVGPAEARVVAEDALSYVDLPVSPAPNRGIEGFCADGDTLIAGVEPTVTADGARRTAVALRRGAGEWTGFELALTSATGKLSALACRDRGAFMEVFAVERHYDVMRVLRFEVPLDGGSGVIEPQLARDLAGELDGDPNLEGLTIDGDDLVLVNDNFYGERSGPNELVRLTNALL